MVSPVCTISKLLYEKLLTLSISANPFQVYKSISFGLPMVIFIKLVSDRISFVNVFKFSNCCSLNVLINKFVFVGSESFFLTVTIDFTKFWKLSCFTDLNFLYGVSSVTLSVAKSKKYSSNLSKISGLNVAIKSLTFLNLTFLSITI